MKKDLHWNVWVERDLQEDFIQDRGFCVSSVRWRFGFCLEKLASDLCGVLWWRPSWYFCPLQFRVGDGEFGEYHLL